MPGQKRQNSDVTKWSIRVKYFKIRFNTTQIVGIELKKKKKKRIKHIKGVVLSNLILVFYNKDKIL